MAWLLFPFQEKQPKTPHSNLFLAFLYGSGNQASVSSPHVATGRALQSYFLKELFLPTPSLTGLKNYVYYVRRGKESQIACQCRSQLQCSRSQKGVRSDKRQVFSTCSVKSPIVYLKFCALEAQKYSF